MSWRIGAGWRSLPAGILVGLCLAGCKSQGPPPDPLFAGHKPQETNAEQAAPVVLAYSEPEVPRNPVALARSGDPTRKNVPGILTNRPVPEKKLPDEAPQ